MRAIHMMLALGLLAACGEDFEPRTTLDGYAVIGVEAERPELGPDEATVVRVHDHDTRGRAVRYAWSLCLYSFGAGVDFACADPALEIAVDADGPELAVDLGPDGVGVRALYDTYGPFPGADGRARTLEDGFDVWVRVESGVEGGRQVRTVKRLRVREGDGYNTNPGVDALTVEGVPTRGGTVTLSVEVPEDAEERYVDPVDGDARREALLFTWYTTDGETDPGLTWDDDHDTELTLPKTAGTVRLFVAVRDGRGGLTVLEGAVVVP
jgi:hypothetical protein